MARHPPRRGVISIGRDRATQTKTRRSRIVPLDPALARRLGVSAGRPARAGRVLPWPDDFGYAAQGLVKRVRARLAGQIEPRLVGYTVARHTFCSLLAQSGDWTLDQIAGISGHTPEVCRRHYAHLLARDPARRRINLA